MGDIVTAIDGEPVGSAGELARIVRGTEDGASVTLEIWRDGRVETLSAAIERREPELPRHAFRMRCPDGECGHRSAEDFGCGDAEECRVEIRCEAENQCTCEVNGEPRDCDEVRGGG